MGGNWLLQQTEIAVPSNYINVANFLIFDVLLISLVFSLTSDISGRMNHVTLKTGEPRKLLISCPPLIGGGLCATNFRRMVLMMSLRVLALLLILVTNMTITGQDISHPRSAMSTVRGLGPIVDFNEQKFDAAVAQRRSCMGTDDNTIYYGEIRNGTICELNMTLLHLPVIISRRLRFINASTDNCTRNILPQGQENNKSTFVCKNAVLDCYHHFENKAQVWNRTCRGVIRWGKGTYILQEGFGHPEKQPIRRLMRQIWNFDMNASYWTNMTMFSDNYIFDGIAAMYTAKDTTRRTTFNEMVQLTRVHNVWFIILIGKSAIIIALLVAAISLRHAGFACTANDEYRLTKLLSSSVAQGETISSERSPIYLNALHSSDRLVVWASERPEARLRNLDRHRLEEQYY